MFCIKVIAITKIVNSVRSVAIVVFIFFVLGHKGKKDFSPGQLFSIIGDYYFLVCPFLLGPGYLLMVVVQI